MVKKRISLRKARQAAKLTQAELAAKVGRTQGEISKLERGKIPPPRIDEAETWAAALGVDPTQLSYGRGA